VHDPPQPRGPKPFTDRHGLGAAQRAELKAVEVAVEEALRVFDVRVPDEIDPGQLR
jgi:hypothetical protein